MPETHPIEKLVKVRPHPTVVQLAGLNGPEGQWIEDVYLQTDEVKGHLAALSHAFARDTGNGVFLIGHYGSGKSHFLAFLTRRLRAGTLVQPAPEVIPLSLLNFRSDNALEDIVGDAMGLTGREADRRVAWGALAERHPEGLLFIFDELSEFLRSKPSPQAFNEDIRFLQFLGEWAAGHRFWVLAAMQEQIEHTGDLEYGLYRKIKDRYPLRLLLSPTHVRELLADSILVKSPGYKAAAEKLAQELHSTFAGAGVDFAALHDIYPIHPVTLDLLEEVRDCFSSARGIVDFAVSQLSGNPERGIAPFLQQPWGSLLTPDYIVDHFHDLLEVQPEFLQLAQRLFPYYRKSMGELFPEARLRELAWRVLKLLILVQLSPERDALKAQEAAAWLLFRVTRIDPARNLAVIRKILDRLVADGRYVRRHGSGYSLDLQDDSAAAMDRMLQRELAELGDPNRVLGILVTQIGDAPFNPFTLPRERWQSRTLRWHYHPRSYALYLGNDTPTATDAEVAICLRLPWGEPEPCREVWSLQPPPLAVGDDLRELAALIRLQDRVLPPEISARVQKKRRERLGLFRDQLSQAYRNAELQSPDGVSEGRVATPTASTFTEWIESCVLWILRRRYPSFERFAPTHGPLPKETYRQLMHAALRGGLEAGGGEEFLGIVREGYLVPMGLMRRRGQEYETVPRLDANELVRLLQPLIEHQPDPRTVYQHMAQPVYGLVPDQIHLLLIFLLIQGELDIVKARRSYRDQFETLPLPQQYDRIVPASALGVDELRELERLCDGLRLRIPSQWTVLAQRRMARRLRETAAERSRDLSSLLVRLREHQGAAALTDQVSRLLGEWRILERGADELGALQQFFYEAGPVARFLADNAGLETLPQRLERWQAELSRLRHLFSQPAFTEGPWAESLAALGEAPGFDRPDDLDAWLTQSRQLYQQYQQTYREAHNHWWRSANEHPVWNWRPPALASSRHLGLEQELTEIEACRQQAYRRRCRGIVNLEYQTLCSCGFDGSSAPLEKDFKQFEEREQRIEKALTHFYAQQSVKERVESWLAEGNDVCKDNQAYLKGGRSLPQISNLNLFDRHLSGLQTVHSLSMSELLGPIAGRSLSRGDLLSAINSALERFPGERLRIEPQSGEKGQDELPLWCLEQALRHGITLPRTMTRNRLNSIVQQMRPEWVSPAALGRLERLELGTESLQRILSWLMEGTLQLPNEAIESPLVSAAAEVLHPTAPTDPQALARLTRQLYLQHTLYMRAAKERWLERLDGLASIRLTKRPPELAKVLKKHAQSQWLVIDALGLPLLNMLEQEADNWFPKWKLNHTTFASVTVVTNTDAFYSLLFQSDTQHSMEKINVLDKILHERFPPFEDLERLATAEIRAEARAIGKRLDTDRPLLVFADHGFRIAKDGTAFVHGGDSTLERVVPLVLLEPLSGQ